MVGYCRIQHSIGGPSQGKQSGARGREAGGYLRDLVCVGGMMVGEMDMTGAQQLVAATGVCMCVWVWITECRITF